MTTTDTAPKPMEITTPRTPVKSGAEGAPTGVTMSTTTPISTPTAATPTPSSPNPGGRTTPRTSPSLGRAAGEVFSFLSGVASAAAGAITSTLAERRYLTLTAPVRMDWREDTRKIWARPIEKLPIDIDLPRLASRITLLDRRQRATPDEMLPNDPVTPPDTSATATATATATEPASPGGPGSSSAAARNYDAVLEFLWKAAYIVEGGAEPAARVRRGFEAAVSRGADLSVQKPALKKFIVDIVGPESRLGHLLKAINQAIIAPSNIEAHLNTLPGLLFKDSQSRPWEVEVRVDDESVEVAHLRGQCHFDARAPETAFEFVLETAFMFDRSLREIKSSSIYVTEWSFTPQTNEARKTELTALFTAHKRPSAPVSPTRQVTHVGRRQSSSHHTI